MKSTTATAIFRAELASAEQGAPEWIELFPAGPTIEARDGRKWTANPTAVLAAFAANDGPLAIDYEHGQFHKAPQGEEAPAAGWIIAVEDRAGAVWGKVDWTAKAAKMIADKEYRFFSPEFDHEEGGLITRLGGGGLVNRPAMVMTALSRETTKQENDTMKAIAKALGLADSTSEDAIVARLNAAGDERKAICRALKIDEAADATAIAAAIETLASATGKANSDATELAALQTQLKDTQTALAALQAKDADREVDAALDAASAEGKITPASRETYRAMCQAEGGLERFKALAATLPVICAPSKIGDTPPTDAGDDIDPKALAAKARAYQTEQAAVGRRVSTSEAVNFVKEQKK